MVSLPALPLQAGGLGLLFALVSLVVWIAVVLAIFDIKKYTKRTAEATERVAAAVETDDDGAPAATDEAGGDGTTDES